jgi:VWFA-related protein
MCQGISAQPQEDAKGYSIDVRTDLVELFLNVRDRDGFFVAGLKENDFRVYDDGDLRDLAFFESEKHPVTVVMLLDTSGSMAKSMLYLQIAASSFLANLRENDRLALFSFGRSMKELAPFTRDKSLLRTQINSLYPEGGTPLWDAIARSMKLLRSVTGRKALLVFTDGADSTSRLSYECIARRCGRSSIPVFVVGCGNAIKDYALRRRLNRLSENSGGQAIYVENTQELQQVFTQLSEVLRTTYHAGYYSKRKPDRKWHTVSVQLKSRRYPVRTRNGYYATK